MKIETVFEDQNQSFSIQNELIIEQKQLETLMNRHVVEVEQSLKKPKAERFIQFSIGIGEKDENEARKAGRNEFTKL